MANPVDVTVTQEALSQMKALRQEAKLAQDEMLKLAQNALTASRNISKISTPSGYKTNSSNNADTTSSIRQQTEAIKSLSIAKQNLNQKTAEEIVNQGILNRNARQSVIANSQLAGAYANLSAQQSRASRTLQDLIARGRLATQTQKQHNAELKTAQRDFDRLNQKVLLADKAVGRFNRNVGNYPQVARGFTELLGAFGIGLGIGLIAEVTKDIFNQTRELQSLDLALKQVIGTQEDYVRAQSFLLRLSEQYGVGIKELTKSYTQFYVSAKDKLSGQEIEDIFESISKASGAMGLSIEQQEGAFLALTQMLSKGTIQAEELRGQLSERLPGAFGILAKSMGVTEVQLNKMLKDGKVLAAEVLPAFARELEKAYGIETLNRVESLNASTTRLSNGWTNFIRSLNEGSGAFSSFLQIGINNLTQILNLTAMLFTSNEKLRQSYLNSQKALGGSNAKATLDKFKESDEKEAYANEAIIKTRLEIAKNTEEFNRLKAENANYSTQNESNTIQERRHNNYEIEINDKKIKSLNNLIAKQVGYVDGLKKYLAEKNKVAVAEEETDKERKEREKREEERLKTLFQISQKELELRLLTIDKTLKDEEMFYQERLVALELHRIVTFQMLTNQYNEELRLAKGNQLKQKEALLNYHASTLKEMERYNSERGKLEDLALKPVNVPVRPDNFRDSDMGMLKPYLTTQEALKENADKVIDKLNEQNESYKRQKELLAQLIKATDEYIGSFSNSFLADAGLGSLQQFFDGTFNRLMAGADTLQEKFSTTFLAITEVAQEAFNFINKASQQNFDAEYRRLELQKEVAVKFAGESTSAQERITTEYDRRKKEIQRREAEAQKKIAVFNILINTAQGVVSALASTPPNVPLSIAIGLIGALQAGIVQAQPIPQFFEGGTHKGGIMMVNDAKGNSYKETVVTPDGKVIKPQGRNVLMNAPAGTEIFTPEQWKAKENALGNILAERGISFNPNIMRNFAFGGQTGLSKSDFDNGINRLSKNISNATKPMMSVDRKGIRLYEVNGAKRTERLNRRFNIG